MAPSIRPERALSRAHGGVLVAGVDEAGRGPIAGPVVAGAVIFDLDAPRPRGLDDSKKLPHATRERLYGKIVKSALAWGVGVATAQEIDMMNILEATRLAARRAIAVLDPQPGAFVTDALAFRSEPRPVEAIIRGDATSVSIAAASILAKVTRDRMMDAYAREFPGYGWEHNRGYPTAEHYDAVERLGATTLHRLSFAGVGFFEMAPVRARSFVALAARLDGGEDPDALWWEAQRLGDALPPPDRDELLARIEARRGALR